MNVHTYSFSNRVSSPTFGPLPRIRYYRVPIACQLRGLRFSNRRLLLSQLTDKMCFSTCPVPTIDRYSSPDACQTFYQILRSLVGCLLGQDVYARVGVSRIKYVHQASKAQHVQFGGVGGHAPGYVSIQNYR